MADDDKKPTEKTPEKTPEAAPGLTEDQVKSMIAEGVKDALAEVTPAAAASTATVDPLDAVIQPRVAKAIAQPLMAVVAAADFAAFYNHPESAERARRLKHQKDIEDLFTQGVKEGRPYKRDDWWSFYRGKPENFDKFVDEHAAEKAAGTRAAEGEVTVGPGSPMRGTVVKKDPFEMKPEDLDKALDGVSF